MTAASLKNQTCKDLAQLAKKRGVPGWHAMRKEQLIKALLRATTKSSQARRKAASTLSRTTAPPSRATAEPPSHVIANGRKPAREAPPPKPKNPVVARRIAQAKAAAQSRKNLATLGDGPANGAEVKDRLVVMVRDPYWLHAYWDLSRQAVKRAEAALGQEWHGAKPTLRVYEVTNSGSANSAETWMRDIDIHGGVRNWYIDVPDPPKSYRVDIGYLTATGRFFSLGRSNIVSTPAPGSSDAIDENWAEVAENFEKIYAMSGGYAPDGVDQELQQLFEERLRRPMGSPLATRYGAGADVMPRRRSFHFELDAELIVFGKSEPDAHVTLQGDPVRLRPDGTFTVRFSLPNCRQVIPAVASSVNGLEQQTIVLAVERNTKTMEPLVRDANE